MRINEFSCVLLTTQIDALTLDLIYTTDMMISRKLKMFKKFIPSFSKSKIFLSPIQYSNVLYITFLLQKTPNFNRNYTHKGEKNNDSNMFKKYIVFEIIRFCPPLKSAKSSPRGGAQN